MTPETDYEWFVRKVVDTLDRYQDDGKALTLTPEDKVRRAQRVADAFIGTGDFGLTENNAVTVAAVIVAAEEADDHPLTSARHATPVSDSVQGQ